MAGGFELACMCDARVVEETAIMGVFCRRFGKMLARLYESFLELVEVVK